VNVKHLSISSYNDLKKISSSVKVIHFRKFASQKLVKWILDNHSQIRKFSFSKYVYSRSESSVFDLIKEKNVEMEVRDRIAGRPNLLEAIHL